LFGQFINLLISFWSYVGTLGTPLFYLLNRWVANAACVYGSRCGFFISILEDWGG
jgi:hypothetical protein